MLSTIKTQLIQNDDNRSMTVYMTIYMTCGFLHHISQMQKLYLILKILLHLFILTKD